jgi:CBS domain-containing protein
MKVHEVMMRRPASCAPETNLGAAVEILWNRNYGMQPVVAEHKVRRLPVVSQDGVLEGILSTGNVILPVQVGRWRRTSE